MRVCTSVYGQGAKWSRGRVGLRALIWFRSLNGYVIFQGQDCSWAKRLAKRSRGRHTKTMNLKILNPYNLGPRTLRVPASLRSPTILSAIRAERAAGTHLVRASSFGGSDFF